MREAIDVVGAAQIATQQVEIHPFLQNRKVVEFARSQGIRVTAYMPLAYGKVMAEPLLARIGARHGANAAQVALAWSLQQGYAVIPSSTRRANLEANLRASDLVLSADEMARIAALERGERLANPPGLAPRGDWGALFDGPRRPSGAALRSRFPGGESGPANAIMPV